jgi:hypothetical protein
MRCYHHCKQSILVCTAGIKASYDPRQGNNDGYILCPVREMSSTCPMMEDRSGLVLSMSQHVLAWDMLPRRLSFDITQLQTRVRSLNETCQGADCPAVDDRAQNLNEP